ncbi:MAG: DUF4190 domain-containing protein [Nocardioidaceae bacterium]|nr:DUF4190 domain-containing protein [Nocardioidaceae bacterium]
MSSTAHGADEGRDTRSYHDLPKAKTSATAVFALIFGLLAFFGILSILFSPIALPLAVLGLIFGVVGIKRTTEPQRTGKALAIIGLILSVLALVLAVAAVVGGFILLDDPGVIDWLDTRLADARENLPAEVPKP